MVKTPGQVNSNFKRVVNRRKPLSDSKWLQRVNFFSQSNDIAEDRGTRQMKTIDNTQTSNPDL